MTSPGTRNAALLVVALLFGATVTMAQDTVKKAPAKMTPASSGQQMFNSYCAVCHGLGGRGDGPAAAEFKTPPANLTFLTRNNNGVFPEAHVAETIQTGPRDAKAHGSTDMPVWGKVFASMGDAATVKLRIRNLTAYIETLQEK